MFDRTEPPAVTAILARLVGEMPLVCGADDGHDRMPVYRPLIIGPAILRRPGARGEAWRVTLEAGTSVRPRAPGSRVQVRARTRALQAAGVPCRVAAALVSPADVVAAPDATGGSGVRLHGRRCRSEFYGWSLLYQPSGAPRVGLVEPHPVFSDLPAFFESPLELLDRAEFLTVRGIRSRPIVLFTEPDDFDTGPDGALINRFFPHGTFRPPTGLDWLG